MLNNLTAKYFKEINKKYVYLIEDLLLVLNYKRIIRFYGYWLHHLRTMHPVPALQSTSSHFHYSRASLRARTSQQLTIIHK